jgi:hypothetical protein
MISVLRQRRANRAAVAVKVKHDGFKFVCRRDGDRVQVFSRPEHYWY